MATSPTQIRIDQKVKEEATLLFAKLGMDMSSAVNIFLRQCILHEGLPFSVSLPHYRQDTLQAMVEAKQIAHDETVSGYHHMTDLMHALDAD